MEEATQASGRLEKSKFLDQKTIVNLLNNPLIEPYSVVPNGRKEDKYFVVDNTGNIERKLSGQKNVFYDDCGAWNAATSPNTTLMRLEDGSFTSVLKHDSLICNKRQHDGRAIYVPVAIQPEEKDVVTLHRYYANLKSDNSYKRRVSWFPSSTHAIYEYMGSFPGRLTHGNKTKDENVYIRTPPDVIDHLGKEALELGAAAAYSNSVSRSTRVSARNKKQVSNKRYSMKRKEREQKAREADLISNAFQIFQSMS